MSKGAWKYGYEVGYEAHHFFQDWKESLKLPVEERRSFLVNKDEWYEHYMNEFLGLVDMSEELTEDIIFEKTKNYVTNCRPDLQGSWMQGFHCGFRRV